MDILKTLYYALIYPHISYAIEVWGSADTTHMDKILVLQKRIVRMITLSDQRQDDFAFPTANPLFLQLGILKVKDIFILQLAKFVFKCLNRSNPVIFHPWFTSTYDIHHHNTRSKYVCIGNNVQTRTLFIPCSRTTYYGLKRTKVLGAKIWNGLPMNLRTDDLTFSIFSKEIKKYLFGSNY